MKLHDTIKHLDLSALCFHFGPFPYSEFIVRGEQTDETLCSYGYRTFITVITRACH